MKALIVGIILGVASQWLPHQTIDPIARLLVPATALLATSIFPCMSLAVGSLKAEQRSPSQVDELYTQLATIMRVLVVTFALAVTTVALIASLTGLMAVSGQQAIPPQMPSAAKPNPFVSVAIQALLALVGLALALLGGRVVAVGRAFFAILEINRKHALLVARSKVQGEYEKTIDGSRKQNFTPDNSDSRPLERSSAR